jgi:radical SAM protein with 4Fe4S-binding SPASM domain
MKGKFAALTGAPRWVVLQLTEKCSLRCSMCYEWGQTGSYHQQAAAAELDYDVAEKVIAEVAPYQPYFGLFGGEPLLYPKLAAVLELMQRFGCAVDIPTNGLLLGKYADMLVETGPRRLWVSLDGPQAINDLQRGAGVFQRVTAGLAQLYEARQSRRREYPKLGVTFIVTPLNYRHVRPFFEELFANFHLDHISVEFQNYATLAEYQAYCQVLRQEFGVSAALLAAGMTQEPASFDALDCEELARQILAVKQLCAQRQVYFIAYPKTISAANYRAFFTANWRAMADWKVRCAFPWIYAEINARGNVTSCHTFYDLTLGNVYDHGLLEIWRSAAYERYRSYLRQALFPICTACSRYYSDPGKK